MGELSGIGLRSRKQGGVVPRACVALCLGIAVACVPERADERSSVGSDRQAVAQDAGTPARRVVPNALSVTVREVPEGYEVEIVSPSGFPPGDITPVLRIGDVEFTRFKESPTAGLYGIVFPLTGAEFAALPNGSSIAVGFGPGSHPGLTFRGRVVGTLDKSAVRK